MTGPLPPTGPPEQPSTPGDAGIAGSVTGQWAEVYPPDGHPSDDAEPDVEPLRAGVPGNAFATSMFVLTLVLVVVGSITPLFRASVALGPSFTNVDDVLSMDAWQLDAVQEAPGLPTQAEPAPVPMGYPLLLVALLLAVVIVLRLRAHRRSGDRLARVLGVATASFLAGLVVALGLFEAAWRALGISGIIGPLSANIGIGFWVLVIAAVVGIAAAVVGFRSVPVETTAAVVVPIVDPPLVPPGQPAEWPVVAVIPNDERTNW
ncbi:MAG TPA: hypothetical protein VH352_12730 [Pseudonocardiaceae bacterium]|nr:hypothetical protein [Pseudonocardiaceae bacterium]